MSVESIGSAPAVAVQQQSTTQNSEALAKAANQASPGSVREVPDTTSVEVEKAANREELDTAVTKLNDFMQNSPQRNLSFRVDEESKAMVVVVTDATTNEVIRQMPSKEALAVARQIESMLGLILNDKA